MPARLREARPALKAMVTDRVRELSDGQEFDAMRLLAALLPVEAIAHFVGLPAEGRERMLDWAAATFNAIGPDQTTDDLTQLSAARAYMAGLDGGKVTRASWAAELFAAADDGRLSKDEALAAISAYVIPSLDTTILAMGHLLNDLARDPDQWALLRAKPELISAAVSEGVRHSSVIRWFSRHASVDYAVDGHVIPAGSRVMFTAAPIATSGITRIPIASTFVATPAIIWRGGRDRTCAQACI